MGDRRRVIVVGLDGFELSIAEAMMAEGRLPGFRKLKEQAATGTLDHGDARDTGLAWEHFSTGQAPDAYERWSAVDFDARTYATSQEPARARPFLADVPAPVVAFDVPYLDLETSPGVQGMANWGAHDPGVAAHARPASLADEIAERFGPYPGAKYIYGFVWPSPEKTADMARAMAEAVRKRADITLWLLQDRLPDWDLGITVVAELHSAAEALWHGWDETHALHAHPSAAAARQGIEAVYEETDRLITRLAEAFPEAALVVFSMHGMGPNLADLPSMALLPEVMFRRQFGRAHMVPRKDWTLPLPALGPEESWSAAVNRQIGIEARAGATHLARRLSRKLFGGKPAKPGALAWMPATHYRPFWPNMDAFALPAFYDGQIRVNLQGREAQGRVPIERYKPLLDELETLVCGMTDPVSGEPVVAGVERPMADNPFDRHATRCDLKIHWRRNAFALDVPGIGTVGPVPQRRTGGHTGDFGYAALANTALAPGDFGTVSAFDMVPTILSLMNAPRPNRLSGQSLV